MIVVFQFTLDEYMPKILFMAVKMTFNRSRDCYAKRIRSEMLVQGVCSFDLIL